MSENFLTIQRQVEILVDIIGNRIGMAWPATKREAFLQEAERWTRLFFRTDEGKRRLSQTDGPTDELALLELALFRVTGRMRDWISKDPSAE